MSLTDTIAKDLMAAMKAQDRKVLEALRAAKTAFIMAKSEKGSDAVLPADEEIRIIQKLVKQRKEAAAIYREQKRPDLYEKEEEEAAVLEKYLPVKMSEEELTAVLKSIVEIMGAKSPADMGKVMGAATKQLAGKADGREISAIVRQLLS